MVLVNKVLVGYVIGDCCSDEDADHGLQWCGEWLVIYLQESLAQLWLSFGFQVKSVNPWDLLETDFLYSSLYGSICFFDLSTFDKVFVVGGDVGSQVFLQLGVEWLRYSLCLEYRIWHIMYLCRHLLMLQRGQFVCMQGSCSICNFSLTSVYVGRVLSWWTACWGFPCKWPDGWQRWFSH